ncbi:1,4-dihydroxy-2-naphthoate octaprenyltransferase [bacterium SCSIO 12643]|nr:1,4-dihydroxy-2-naphthoate octaprenyltransferase [bacterium SCSIO 12643]
MSNFKAWIGAFRLRTLPLAVAGIILGSLLAKSNDSFNLNITLFAILTAILLQILSNLANDYGDFSKGTDNDERVGPERALQSGKISKSQMKSALILFSILSLISGIILLWLSFGTHKLGYAMLFLLIGLSAIWAAIKYTVGKSAYGYQGLGDVFVFLFFGWVSVIGVYFLQVQSIDLPVFLPASALGILSAGVLNLNNTRDIVNDKNSGKYTLAVKLGYQNARKYQMVLFLLTLFTSLWYTLAFGTGMWQQLFWISVLPLSIVVIKTYKAQEPKELDPLLKIQALSTLLYAITFGLGQIL